MDSTKELLDFPVIKIYRTKQLFYKEKCRSKYFQNYYFFHFMKHEN